MQCSHEFAVDEIDGQVKCKLCGDLDGEMQLVNPVEEIKDEKDAFYATQTSFE